MRIHHAMIRATEYKRFLSFAIIQSPPEKKWQINELIENKNETNGFVRFDNAEMDVLATTNVILQVIFFFVCHSFTCSFPLVLFQYTRISEMFMFDDNYCHTCRFELNRT